MITDTVVTPLAARLVGCLQTQVDLLDEPVRPKRVGLRPGAQAPIMLSVTKDECCDGVAWVRLTGISHSSTQNWPSADVIPQGLCGPQGLALKFELGIVRCAPTPPASQIVSVEKWNEVAEATYLDYIVLERTICCFLDSFKVQPLNLVGDWSPMGVDGNCVGGTLEFTVRANPCACEDIESTS